MVQLDEVFLCCVSSSKSTNMTHNFHGTSNWCSHSWTAFNKTKVERVIWIPQSLTAVSFRMTQNHWASGTTSDNPARALLRLEQSDCSPASGGTAGVVVDSSALCCTEEQGLAWALPRGSKQGGQVTSGYCVTIAIALWRQAATKSSSQGVNLTKGERDVSRLRAKHTRTCRGATEHYEIPLSPLASLI